MNETAINQLKAGLEKNFKYTLIASEAKTIEDLPLNGEMSLDVHGKSVAVKKVTDDNFAYGESTDGTMAGTTRSKNYWTVTKAVDEENKSDSINYWLGGKGEMGVHNTTFEGKKYKKTEVKIYEAKPAKDGEYKAILDFSKDKIKIKVGSELEFTYNLSDGDVGDYWNSFTMKDKVYDFNFSMDEADVDKEGKYIPRVAIYPVINGKTDTSKLTSVKNIQIIGDINKYFGSEPKKINEEESLVDTVIAQFNSDMGVMDMHVELPKDKAKWTKETAMKAMNEAVDQENTYFIDEKVGDDYYLVVDSTKEKAPFTDTSGSTIYYSVVGKSSKPINIKKLLDIINPLAEKLEKGKFEVNGKSSKVEFKENVSESKADDAFEETMKSFERKPVSEIYQELVTNEKRRDELRLGNLKEVKEKGMTPKLMNSYDEADSIINNKSDAFIKLLMSRDSKVYSREKIKETLRKDGVIYSTHSHQELQAKHPEFL